MRTTSRHNIYVTSITKFELEYGLLKKPHLRTAYEKQLDLLYRQINHLYFDDYCALVASAVKHQLLSAGTPIGIENVLIGAIALHYGFTVVTSNIKHFEKIEGLEIENWKQ